jgi:DNA-binding response OmpR family regulator
VRILIIEDDRSIGANLYDFLTDRGHAVESTGDGLTGLHLAVTRPLDAIVLDLGLPGMDGLTLCDRLRRDAQLATPVLMLTARDTLGDKLHGFDAGADDYLVKPFALKELEARLLALHKRTINRVTSKVLVAGDLTLDTRTLSVRFSGDEVKLPPKCIRMLEFLMSDPERVFSRSELELEVWGEAQETSDTLRSHMHILRRGLADAGHYDPIETVHGLGYRLLTHARREA